MATTNEQLAWAAGLFDADGNTTHKGGTRKTKSRTAAIRYRNLNLTVSKTDVELVQKFQKAIGRGRICGPYMNPKKQRVIYRFCATSFEDVQYVLCLLWKWLGTTKREQARRAIQAHLSTQRFRTNGVAIALLLLCATPAAAQDVKPFSWTPTVIQAAGMSADTLSTHTCGGEKNPTFWTNGDWRRPNYNKMWVYNTVGVVVLTGARYVTHAARKNDPKSRTARWADRGLGALQVAGGGYRAGVAVRNLRRCVW